MARRLASDWLRPWGGAAMSALILASVFGTLNGIILTNARVPFALARSGFGFRALGRVHPRFATPHVAIGVQAAVAIALVFWLESFARLSTYFVLVEWSALVFAIAAIFVLRRRTPALARLPHPGLPAGPPRLRCGRGRHPDRHRRQHLDGRRPRAGAGPADRRRRSAALSRVAPLRRRPARVAAHRAGPAVGDDVTAWGYFGVTGSLLLR